MGRFEYGLAGVMAFLVLGILATIAVWPDDAPGGEGPEAMPAEMHMEMPTTEPSAEPTPEHPTEPPTGLPHGDVEPAAMHHSHEVLIPAGTSVPGCETADECFVPPSITITAGHTVVWTNGDAAAHTVTSGNLDSFGEIFDSGLLSGAQTFEHTFGEPGNYDYFCIVHPWMVGTIRAI